jgi:hypothetical protein
MRYPKVPRVERPQMQSVKVTGLLAGVLSTEIALALIRLAGKVAGAVVTIRKPRRKPWPPPPAVGAA